MSQDNAILNASLVYSRDEIIAEFQECCEQLAEAPGESRERLQVASRALCMMLDRNVEQKTRED